MGSILFGRESLLILALRSRIFEYLRGTFTDMPWSTCNRLVEKKKKVNKKVNKKKKKKKEETPEH